MATAALKLSKASKDASAWMDFRINAIKQLVNNIIIIIIGLNK